MDTKVVETLYVPFEKKAVLDLIVPEIQELWNSVLEESKKQVAYKCEDLKVYFVWANGRFFIIPFSWENDIPRADVEKYFKIRTGSSEIIDVSKQIYLWGIAYDNFSKPISTGTYYWNGESYTLSGDNSYLAFATRGICSKVDSREALNKLWEYSSSWYGSRSSNYKRIIRIYEITSITTEEAFIQRCLVNGILLEARKTFNHLYKKLYEIVQESSFLSFKLNKDGLVFKLSSFTQDNMVTLCDKLSINSIVNQIIANYLIRDTLRFDVEPYDRNRITDPNQGLWDLWDNTESQHKEDMFPISLTDGDNLLLYARDPRADIRWDGNVAIDFGTRSTVVAFQENTEATHLMRIGTGQLNKDVKGQHYENPTILECIDLESFMEDYISKEGRPETKWTDMTSSHTAISDLITAEVSQFSAFIQSLKQWAGDGRRSIQFKDKKGKHYVLPPYENLEEGGFDPIEIYAYYIGLAINNMRNGIYIDYTLSFPVTYEKKVRELIINSFTRGLKKSLPSTILEDEAVMADFSVASGASEPAAYALCALQTYGFNPTEEGLMYGVFDFGGGTTDFDFGVIQAATGRDVRRYDYVLTCFGAGGDKYLGGENLLELLTYEVFKSNAGTLRENEISFTRPVEGERFAADEVLVSTSQSAEMNTRILMEKLRCFWECPEGYENLYNTGVLKLNLYSRKDELVKDVEIEFSTESMESILKTRIEKGVKNFFEAMRLAFKNSECSHVDTVHCLLAGNSSRSTYVKEIFEKYMNNIEAEIPNLTEEDVKRFVLYPPLGTPEADAIISENTGKPYESTVVSPTGKTGVVYGLLEGRAGGRVKVIQNNYTSSDAEIRFPYYIGYGVRGKLNVLTTPETPYQEWTEFIDASEKFSTLYYSSLPEASTHTLPIEKVSRKKIRLSKTYDDESVCIFYRIINPTTIEYAVGTQEEIEAGEYREGPIAVQFVE